MKKKKSLKEIAKNEGIQPYSVGEEIFASTTMRRNAASTIERTDKFANIENGLIPFKNSSSIYGTKSGGVDVRDAVILCQKCYYNFSTFRNVIDLMTEFSVNDITFKGGSKKSKEFFQALFKKINLWDLQDQFFREYYRSGNVFIYRFDATIDPSEVNKITQVYGQTELDRKVEPFKIPSRYIILNPADIQMTGTVNFTLGNYYKILNDFEIFRLKNPLTDEDKEVLNALPAEVKTQITKGSASVLLQLDPSKTSIVFYKKQDYEPFAVPMGYPVLEDINAKAEMKKIDMAIARTMQQIILVVTTGAEPEKGGVNQKHLDALKTLFSNQSVGRVLIADYTTKAEWAVPAIGDLLNPAKYEILERDINIGLNNVFAGGEKFANQAQKVELFIARLEQGRNAFLNNFLIPEIKRISKSLGFKVFPTPQFEDIELKDNTNFAKLYVRLMELGLMTPEQGLRAIETNNLPDPLTNVEEHEQYKKLRDKGLYEPLVGGGKGEGENGRPTGAAIAPKKVTPIGKASVNEEKYSISKLKDSIILAQELESKVVSKLKSKHKIKKLNNVQQDVAEQITHLIIANEEPSNWEKMIASYIDLPEDKNKERVNSVIEIAANHGISPYLASLLFASKLDE